jgi:hypothetical protein
MWARVNQISLGLPLASLATSLTTLALLAGCAADPNYGGADPLAPVDPGPPVWPRGLHVSGTDIQDGQGQTIRLHGVNRSGTEYRCVQGGGFFDGPFDAPSVAAITTWPGVNAVRVPLNESCWLGINGSPEAYSGDAYKTAIANYVNQLHKHKLVPILELHWVGPGTTLATRQQPMPDADHAPAFWADVATTFLADDGVVLEAYNEPFPDGNKDSDAAWACWRDGCAANQYANGSPPTVVGTYPAAGMQAIVDAIRATGSTHVVLLGGVVYSNALTQWLAYRPTDPLNSLGAAWHLYNFNGCVASNCWDGQPAAVAAAVPLVATEIGEDDCAGGFITPLMQWLDGHDAGYLAWSWNAFGACQAAPMPGRGGKPWSLVTDYVTGTPNSGFAQTFHDHVAGL